MARRGVMTALQAALAGIGGAAGGYVQQEERKRKQKQEDDARAQQDFLTRFSLTQAGARPRQAPVPGMAPEAPGTPPQYQTIGTFGGVEYEALTPEAKALQSRQERVAGIEAEIAARATAENKRWDSARTQVVAALDKIEKKYLPEGIRDLALSGGFGIDPAKAIETAFAIANQNRATDVAASRAARTGDGTEGPSLTSLRMTAIKDFRDENAREPTKEDEPEIRRRVNIYQPGTYATMEGIYSGGAEAPKPAAAPTAPSMTTPAGGMFARDMFASPVGAAQPSSQEEIRALAVKLAELNRGGFLGTIAAKDQYNRNAPKRAQVQAALDEARRRYRPIR
jgi:hypothetical protein